MYRIIETLNSGGYGSIYTEYKIIKPNDFVIATTRSLQDAEDIIQSFMEYQSLKEENEKLKRDIEILKVERNGFEHNYSEVRQQRDKLVEMLERILKTTRHYLSMYHNDQECVDLGANWDIEGTEQLLQKLKNNFF